MKVWALILKFISYVDNTMSSRLITNHMLPKYRCQWQEVSSFFRFEWAKCFRKISKVVNYSFVPIKTLYIRPTIHFCFFRFLAPCLLTFLRAVHTSPSGRLANGVRGEFVLLSLSCCYCVSSVGWSKTNHHLVLSGIKIDAAFRYFR